MEGGGLLTIMIVFSFVVEKTRFQNEGRKNLSHRITFLLRPIRFWVMLKLFRRSAIDLRSPPSGGFSFC
jgi:hypothetical protein